jgi:hypothetical protein
MVIVAVDDGDIHGLSGELANAVEATEPRTDDHHLGPRPRALVTRPGRCSTSHYQVRVDAFVSDVTL